MRRTPADGTIGVLPVGIFIVVVVVVVVVVGIIVLCRLVITSERVVVRN